MVYNTLMEFLSVAGKLSFPFLAAGIVFVGMIVFEGLAWQIFNSVAPETVEKIKLRPVLRDIKHYFGYLFDKGYKIHSTEYSYKHFGNWSVQLESPECIIYIANDRSELSLGFRPIATYENNRFGLGTMIYYISRGQKFIGYFEGDLWRGKKKQFERLAGLLGEYHDQIVFCLGGDFEKHRDDLISTRKPYNDLLLSDFRQRHLKNTHSSKQEIRRWTLGLSYVFSCIAYFFMIAKLMYSHPHVFNSDDQFAISLFLSCLLADITTFAVAKGSG